MGRSVDYPSNAEVVMYIDTNFGYDDEDGEFDADIAREDWNYFIDDLKSIITAKYTSFYETDEWVGRELHAILENSFAKVIISEYCGLTSVSLVPKEYDCYYSEDIALQNLSYGWTSQIARNFAKLIAKNFTSYVKIGSMSNGEGVFSIAK